MKSIPLQTAEGKVIGVIPSGAVNPLTGEVGIWATLRYAGFGHTSLIMTVPVSSFWERLHPPSGLPAVSALRWWLLRMAHYKIVTERPELASAKLLDEEVFWYNWAAKAREPFLR